MLGIQNWVLNAAQNIQKPINLIFFYRPVTDKAGRQDFIGWSVV